MKKGIARIVARRVTPMLILAYIVLLVGAFAVVSHLVREDAMRSAKNISGIYADLVNYNAEQDGVPLDEKYADRANFFGDYFCKWNGIDYAYMYIPDTEKDTIKYIAFSQNENVEVDIAKSVKFGYELPHKLTEGEQAVWNGETFFSIDLLDNISVTVMMTELCIEDSFGNRIMAGIGISYTQIYAEVIRSFLITAGFMLLVFAGIYFIIYRIVKKRISDPARNISQIMIDYAADVADSDVRLNEDGCLEYAMISSAFNSMSDDISKYIENINQLTDKQLKQQAELDVASRIQQGFLPHDVIYSDDFYIQCKMRPARNIGGDLYDYIRLDDDRTVIVIADVSGKGITAAIFMAVTLMLIREYSKSGLAPAEVLAKANNTIAEKNPALLFATVFVGIYDRRNHSFTYSNAGHNMPYLICDKLVELEKVQGIPLGLFSNEEYRESSVTLKQGDTLFLYTDGVNEIVNGNNEFYGTERLEDLLSNYVGRDATYLVNEVFDKITEFAGDTEQFDDITMLALTCRNSTSLELDYSIEEFAHIRDLILTLPIERSEQLNLCLAAEEIFVNICSYAFPEGVPEGEKIKFTLSQSDVITLKFEDGGVPFNPIDNMNAISDYDPDLQLGGLGGSITGNIVDSSRYEYTDNKNVLSLVKKYREDR